jgi:hypothetical protein
MSGGDTDPDAVSDSAKLDQLLGLVTTMNTRLDRQSQRLTLVEAALPLLAQACGITLSLGLVGRGPSTGTGSRAPANTDTTPSDVDDVLDQGDGQDSRAVEPTRSGNNSGSGRGGGFTLQGGGGGRGQGSGLGNVHFGRDCGDDRSSQRLKLTFPSFDGESEPLPWLNKCSIYFSGMGTPADERAWMAALHLDGVAAEWYYALARDVGVLTWPRFSEYVNMRFGPPLRRNGLAELKELTRTSSVEDYQRQFLTSLCCCDDMTPMQQTQMFTAGLGEPLRTNVELAVPTDLQAAMCLARAYEWRLVTSKPGAKQISSTTKSTTSSVASTSQPRFRRLSPEELTAK